MIEFEAFKSSQTHLVVFRAGLLAVSKVGYDEALVQNLSSLTAGALTAALGPMGLLLSVVAQAEELHKEVPKAPELEAVPLEVLLESPEPSFIVHGQVPEDLRWSSKWPGVEWFRPVLAVPRASLVQIEVKWTSAVTWRTASVEQGWRTEIHFWRVPSLRRRLKEWGYPIREP